MSIELSLPILLIFIGFFVVIFVHSRTKVKITGVKDTVIKKVFPVKAIKDPNEYLKTESSTGWHEAKCVCWTCLTLRSWNEALGEHCNNCSGPISISSSVSERTIWDGVEWITQWRNGGVGAEYMLNERCENGYEWVRYYEKDSFELRHTNPRKPYKVIGTDEVVR